MKTCSTYAHNLNVTSQLLIALSRLRNLATISSRLQTQENRSYSSLTRHTSLSMLASFLLSISNAFCARSNIVFPSTILCFCGFTTPSLSIAGIISACKWYLKNSFYSPTVSFSVFQNIRHTQKSSFFNLHANKNASLRPSPQRHPPTPLPGGHPSHTPDPASHSSPVQ